MLNNLEKGRFNPFKVKLELLIIYFLNAFTDQYYISLYYPLYSKFNDLNVVLPFSGSAGKSKLRYPLRSSMKPKEQKPPAPDLSSSSSSRRYAQNSIACALVFVSVELIIHLLTIFLVSFNDILCEGWMGFICIVFRLNVCKC